MARKKEVSDYVKRIKRGARCPGCGRTATTVGRKHHFHHLDPSTKLFDIGDSGSRSLDQVKEEIEKCVLICYQCHRRLHMRDGFEIAIIRSIGGYAHLDIIGSPE